MTKTICVAVADSASARIFSTNPGFTKLEELQDFANPEARLRDTETETDRPGQQKFGGEKFNNQEGSQNYDGDRSNQRHLSRLFAVELANFLDRERAAGNYDELIVAAPPEFLGDLRNHLSDECKKVMKKQIDKHLVRESSKDILARLSA